MRVKGIPHFVRNDRGVWKDLDCHSERQRRIPAAREDLVPVRRRVRCASKGFLPSFGMTEMAGRIRSVILSGSEESLPRGRNLSLFGEGFDARRRDSSLRSE